MLPIHSLAFTHLYLYWNISTMINQTQRVLLSSSVGYNPPLHRACQAYMAPIQAYMAPQSGLTVDITWFDFILHVHDQMYHFPCQFALQCNPFSDLELYLMIGIIEICFLQDTGLLFVRGNVWWFLCSWFFKRPEWAICTFRHYDQLL